MNKLLYLTFFFFLLSVSSSAQGQYFHELRGIEDSTGTTHLFYRLFNLNSAPVDPETCCFDWTNHVNHFNTFIESDSVIFKSFTKPVIVSPGISDDFIDDYLFIENDLSKSFWLSNTSGSWSNQYSYDYSYNGSFFHTGHHWGNKISHGQNDTLSFFAKNFENESALVILNNDSLPSIQYPYPVLVKANPEEEECADFNDCYLGASDSVLFLGYNFLDINPHQSDAIYLTRNDSLFITQDLGDKIKFLNNSFEWSTIGDLEFGQDSSTIMALTENRFRINGKLNSSSNYQLLQSLNAGQTWTELASDTSRIYLSKLSEFNSLDFYAGIGNSFYYWNQLPNKFFEIRSFETAITGVYGKPDSEVIYILTKDELFEWSNDEFISLKKLGVSNEEEAIEIPNSVILHQNYPNPFNPSTTIAFELDETSKVTLTLFDALGRTMTTLVDEQKGAGAHRVTLDASGFSSGIYFYQLVVGSFIATKKLTLIK